MSHYKIPNWPEMERPREKLWYLGAEHLSEAELLAILIGKGTKEKTAVDLARELLIKFGGIDKLADGSPEEYCQIKGIGKAKAIVIAAAIELAKRLQSRQSSTRRFKTPQDVANVYWPLMKDLKKEVFKALLLNTKNQLIKEITVSKGILNSSLVHPREVFRPAIINSAAAVIVLHNHPSGNFQPSQADKNITRQLKKAGDIIGIPLLDHIILAQEGFYSFASNEPELFT